MKNIIIALIAVITLGSCTQQKIAYVDSSKLLEEYSVMKDFEKTMEEKKASFDAKYNGMMADIQKEYQEFQAKASKMRRKKAEQRSQELNQKYQQIQQMQQGEGYQMQQENQNRILEILKEVTDFVKDYGKTNGYTYILGTNETSGTVLFGKEELDITETVLTALNNSKETHETKEEVKTETPVKEETKTEESEKK